MLVGVLVIPKESCKGTKIMGVDFANYQVFAGNSGAEELHCNLVSQIPDLMAKNGFQTTIQGDGVDRTVVIGPPGRWIWIYDSYATGINPTKHEVGQLATELSVYGAVVNIAVYDSSMIHFFLYNKGRKVDQFVNAPSFYIWYMKKWQPQTKHKEDDFYGQPERWTEILTDSTTLEELRQAWQQKLPNDILQQTAHLVGWDLGSCQGGYIVSDDDYADFRYDEYFNWQKIEVDFSSVRTFYFNL